MDNVNEFQLTDAERAHPLWLRLKAHLQDRLAAARIQNDGLFMEQTMTSVLRGKIGCLHQIIALGDDPPLIPETRREIF